MRQFWSKFMAALLVGLAAAASSALAQETADPESDDPQAAAAEAEDDAEGAKEDADTATEEADEEDQAAPDEPPALPEDPDEPVSAEGEEQAPAEGEQAEPADEEPQPAEEEPAPRDQPREPAGEEEPADLEADVRGEAEGEAPIERDRTRQPSDRDRDAPRLEADAEGEAEGELRGRERSRRQEAESRSATDLGLSFSADRDDRLVVSSIERQSALAAAGIEEGDVLVAVNNRRIASERDFFRWIRLADPESRIALRVLRGGRPQMVYVTYAELYPRGYREQFRVEYDDPAARATLGVVLDRSYGRGALVQSVHPDSAAERAGLQRGDIIIRLDGERVGSPEDLIALIGEREPGDAVDIEFVRPERQQVQARLGAGSSFREEPVRVEERVYREGEEVLLDEDLPPEPRVRGRTRIRVDDDRDEGVILDRDRDGRRFEILRPRD